MKKRIFVHDLQLYNSVKLLSKIRRCKRMSKRRKFSHFLESFNFISKMDILMTYIESNF